MCVRVGARAQTGELSNREQLCFARLHVIQDDTKSEVASDLHLPLILCSEGRVRATLVRFLAKTCPERHDHQCFDGAPCGRDQWVLVGAVDSCTQGRQGKRITVSSIQIHTEREVDINMHTDIGRAHTAKECVV